MRPINELISRGDVLAGTKNITVLDKVGDPIELTLTALSRAKLMELIRKHPEDHPERLLLACAGKGPELLEQLDFDSQMEAQRIAAALCQGLPSAKKMEGAIRAATETTPAGNIAPSAN